MSHGFVLCMLQPRLCLASYSTVHITLLLHRLVFVCHVFVVCMHEPRHCLALYFAIYVMFMFRKDVVWIFETKLALPSIPSFDAVYLHTHTKDPNM